MPDNEEIIETEDETTEPEINVIPSGCGNFRIEKQLQYKFVDSSPDELDGMIIAPGTLAVTYGMANMWQMNAAGEWVEVYTEE